MTGIPDHEHWFSALWSRFGQYGPQDVHYHPCCEGEPSDCYAVMMGAGRDCGGPGSPHERMTLAEDGPQPAEALERLRAAESDSPADPPEDTSRALPTAVVSAQERTAAVPPFDRESLREIVRNAVANWWTALVPSERITETLWPLLEHAQSAAAGSHEGVRLWMLDCGELVAKHRDRADAAEEKLAAITPVLRKLAHRADVRDILAIIGTEEESRG